MNNAACPLTDKHCVPCKGGIPPLRVDEYSKLHIETPEWNIVDETRITRDFKFKDFSEALEFVNKVAGIAEREGHHPDISLHNWNKVLVNSTTHALKGLSENDFILAAKIDVLFSSSL